LYHAAAGLGDNPGVPDGATPRDFSLAVLISGGGTTLRNLLERSADGRLRARVCGVVASRDCAGLAYARAYGVPWAVVPRVAGGSGSEVREGGQRGSFNAQEFSDRVTAVLDRWQPRLVCLAGFLSPYLPPPQYAGRVLNIHPALLPEFGGQGMYGTAVHTAVLASGAQASGASVHLVDERYDHGRILAQQQVAVLPGDTPASLAARVAEAERELYPAVINAVAAGEILLAAPQPGQD
jgi:phosphoribosylglycinamide formyltransferase-1